ncbi:hypothetical protein [Oceanivirga salmonicida]|uniref:hypothetical protein n=1 Tax=Oceanivirga salmonicida TaxID=1769291 RepID=UPI0012E239C5|nr:hypothetical protein [Oceanivirga salmonicida]
MKKILLLSALVASIASVAAATTGEFKIETEHKMKHYKDVAFSEMLNHSGHMLKTSGDVNIAGSGFHLGGDLKFERGLSVKFDDATNKNVFEAKNLEVKDINVYAKYEIPTKVEGLSTYVKGQLGFADLTKTAPADKKIKTTGEANVEYKKDDMEYIFNTKTEAEMQIATTAIFNPKFDSTHKVEIKGKTKVAQDIIAKVEVEHDYQVKAKKFEPNVKAHVELGAGGMINDETSIKFNNKFDMMIHTGDNKYDKEIKDYKVLDDWKKFGDTSEGFAKSDISNKFDIVATWKKDGFELTGNPFVELQSKETKIVFPIASVNDKLLVGYGLDTKAKYTYKNFTVGGHALLGGKYDNAKAAAEMEGKFKFGLYGEYKGVVNDMLTITPRLEAKSEFNGVKASNDPVNKKPSLTGIVFEVIPKLSVEYKPIEKLTLKTSVETPVKFKATKTVTDFGYSETEMKATLGAEYKF